MYCEIIEFATPEFDEEIRLRDKILRKPLDLEFTTEQISEEYNYIHLGCYDGRNKLVACLVLKPISSDEIVMKQVAVDDDQQGKGIGTFMVKESEKIAIDHGYSKMSLHARLTAVSFYINMDYKKIGRQFIEVSIPHYKMEKQLVKT